MKKNNKKYKMPLGLWCPVWLAVINVFPLLMFYLSKLF